MPSARRLVEHALQVLVDAAVRERLPEAGMLLPARRGRRPKVEPAADAWLAALTGSDGRFTADGDLLSDLEEALADEIHVTLVHEIAHFYGIDDEQLHELGWA